MTLYNARDRQTIKETIEFLITQGREITAQIQGQVTSYSSMIVKANCGGFIPDMAIGLTLSLEG